MPQTENFRKQHDEIIEVLQKIEGLTQATPLPARELAKQLAVLADKVNAHLALEDRILYPALARSHDKDVAETAKRFQVEMGGLKAAFVKFYQIWGDAAKIAAHEARFLSALGEIGSALKKRISRENTELYPLAGRV